ncbi:nicotinate-nucleotide--dimethylbenzimidazole phosphoribosyltransferase [Methylobacillus sp. MM3]|uniref:nicotinate-nucleotide--dimethylbenzimidazole phosphoribosyltransferase n=1 Tax=Methylobacillus sp. MM3 TaxID=1848039 RepID=UPI0007DE8560|nr:nicotinate-nucleotide--dimethylbenzimidazole phosphoribosyltransferase [Methylobacillus sp. MM3]OAJ70558.1 nicotinate-nucleotide--dimethylbenzimidazole phosphoribosyltransferase [Methylobacillus sp. MM3]
MPVAIDISINPLPDDIKRQLQSKVDGKTKPLGALGRLERLALQVGQIQGTLSPKLVKPVMLVFAGDHGVATAGVSPFPQEVTRQMVLNFLGGGAAINVFARQNGIAVRVVDAGVNYDFGDVEGLIDAKIGLGTRNFLEGEAMTREECEAAISRGAVLAAQEIAQGTNVLGFGEMGIGNTSSAAIITSKICGLPLAQCVGRGTGLDDDGLQKKQTLLAEAVARHGTAIDPLDVLAAFGGFEIAMMAGAMLGAAQRGALLLIDGYIATSALLVAANLQPAIKDYCVFAHESGEPGHARQLAWLGVEPLLSLDMRLGEGTGAALAYPLVQAAVNFLNEMASFESAGVSGRSEQ